MFAEPPAPAASHAAPEPAPAVPAAWRPPQSWVMPQPDDGRWLADTPQMDLSDPRLRITAQKLTQSRQTHAARAAALYEFVRRMPFAAGPAPAWLRAGDVLRQRSGDAAGKGLLFVALCRAAGLPARLLYLAVRPEWLHGLLDAPPALLPHPVAQVLVDGRWRTTDGYVVDPLLFAQAKSLQRASGAGCGWGVVREAQGRWDGLADSLHQFRAAHVVAVFGAFHDPARFQQEHGARREGWAARLRYAFTAHRINRAAVRLRTSPPSIGTPVSFRLPLPGVSA